MSDPKDHMELYGIPIKTGDWVGEDEVVAINPRDIPGHLEINAEGKVVKMIGRFYKRPRS